MLHPDPYSTAIKVIISALNFAEKNADNLGEGTEVNILDHIAYTIVQWDPASAIDLKWGNHG